MGARGLDGTARRAAVLIIVTDLARFGVAGRVSPLVGLFRVESAVPMGIIMLACGLLATLSLWLVVRPRDVPQIE